MPDYVFKLANGRELVLTGDSMPSDAEVEAAASQAGVRALLVPATYTNHPANVAARTEADGTNGPAAVAVANVARQGVERAAMQVATSPNVGRAVNAVARPLASRAVGAGVGAVIGGAPGAVVGSAIPTAPIARHGARIAETGIRGGSGLLARMAASPFARAATGLPGMLGSMVFDAGDRPAGETPDTTAQRQLDYARQYKEQVNRAAGYEVITGSTAPEIIESIARYRGR
jgi:hypothetical protein